MMRHAPHDHTAGAAQENVMSTQPLMWPFNLFAPGNLNQPILPGWSFGNVSVNYAGNAEIERKVVEDIASYGKQIGILTDAVLVLAKDPPPPDDADPVSHLRKIAARVRELKERNKASLADQARGAMQRLEKAEPATARRIAAEFAKP
jgi:hypothetical protein